MSKKPAQIRGRAFIQWLVDLGMIESAEDIQSVSIRADCEDALWMEVERLRNGEIWVKGLLVGSEATVVSSACKQREAQAGDKRPLPEEEAS